MLYGQAKTDGTRVAYSRTTRHQLSKRLSSLLNATSLEVGFVGALHNSCMLLSSTNALLLNSQSDAPELPAFPVAPALIGDSSLRSLSYTTGIRALEEGLLSAGMFYDAFSKPPSSRVEASLGASQAASRGRTSLASAAAVPAVIRSASATAEEVAAAWSNLGRLYDAINDNEVRSSSRFSFSGSCLDPYAFRVETADVSEFGGAKQCGVWHTRRHRSRAAW